MRPTHGRSTVDDCDRLGLGHDAVERTADDAAVAESTAADDHCELGAAGWGKADTGDGVRPRITSFSRSCSSAALFSV